MCIIVFLIKLIMKKDFETKFVGWAFIFAAIMLWGGWAFSPHHLGEYIKPVDFSEVGENVWFWIWMYRIHIFGWVTLSIALFSFVAISARKPYRVVILPGAGMMIIGSMTLAIAAAFYYNFGAWGVGQTMDKTAIEVQLFMDNILSTNQYVTCFNRFGRIFSGVGLVLLGFALIKWNIVHKGIGYLTFLIGFGAVVLILSIPDNFDLYKPFFHIKVIWMVAMGVWLLLKGLNLPEGNK
jgi:hypothetical protein